MHTAVIQGLLLTACAGGSLINTYNTVDNLKLHLVATTAAIQGLLLLTACQVAVESANSTT
jgi:hypothetical protein